MPEPNEQSNIAPSHPRQPHELEGRVVVSSTKGYTQTVRAGRHELTADEPIAAGGDDLGPDPYALLLASLGACTSMTLRMYANRKNWPLEAVSVALDHGRIHAKDCADCDQEDGIIDRIERRIRIVGDLDDKQRARLLEIADRCPVHRTLLNEKTITTQLVK
jgi:putative redox protein